MGSYLRLIDFLYHSTLGLRLIKRERVPAPGPELARSSPPPPEPASSPVKVIHLGRSTWHAISGRGD